MAYTVLGPRYNLFFVEYDGDTGAQSYQGNITSANVGAALSEDEQFCFYLVTSSPPKIVKMDRFTRVISDVAVLPTGRTYSIRDDPITVSRRRVYVLAYVYDGSSDYDLHLLVYDVNGSPLQAPITDEVITAGGNVNPGDETIGMAHDWISEFSNTSEDVTATGGATWMIRSYMLGGTRWWRLSSLFDGGIYTDYLFDGGHPGVGVTTFDGLAAREDHAFVQVTSGGVPTIRKYAISHASFETVQTDEWTVQDGGSSIANFQSFDISRDGARIYGFPDPNLVTDPPLIRLDLDGGNLERYPIDPDGFRFYLTVAGALSVTPGPTIAPPLRLIQRNDGLGASSAPNVVGTRTRQRGLRPGPGSIL